MTDTTLGLAMSGTYDEHPDFRQLARPLDLDASLLRQFTEAYALAGSTRLPAPLRRPSRRIRRCLGLLRLIFDGLRRQVQDPYALRFFDELEAECRRLMLEELSIKSRRTGQAATAHASGSMARQLAVDLHFYGKLTRGTLDELSEILASEVTTFRHRAAEGRLTRNDLSSNSGVAVRRATRVLNAEFAKNGVNDAVSAYMGYRMSATGLAVELSVPQATWWTNRFTGLPRPPNTVYAHIDESIAYPKSIVYLTPVASTSGPTSCYPGVYGMLDLSPLQALVGRVVGNVGNASDSPLKSYYQKPYHQSMGSPTFRQHFMALPPELRFNSHFGWDVLPESQLEKELVAREELLTGDAGTFIVFDGGHLFHRGGLIREGERVALQVVFSHSSPARRLLRTARRISG